MRTVLTLLIALLTILTAGAYEYTYTFRETPVSAAIVSLCKDHPDINISFIYKELDSYKTSAIINTDNIYEALRQIIARNPISIIHKDGNYYIEAMQHGRYCYTGRTVDNDTEPIAGATVMLLAQSDSTVITYGITDGEGRFSIPCDREGVIAKVSCLGYIPAYRQSESFSFGRIIMEPLAVQLHTVTIDARNVIRQPDKFIFLPTQRQKNASQTGTDLLDQMAIPQIRVQPGGGVQTSSGRQVAIYIDYIPASDNDLKAMRVADVRRVEFYEYPSDPRLQGNPVVVNYILTKYEYGGYVKGFNHTNLIHPSSQLLGSVRYQYKNMIYDVMGYGWGHSSSRYGAETIENFRLPQPDGTEESFERRSSTTSSKEVRQQYFAALKATYSSDRIQAATQLNGSINRKPHADRSGAITYSAVDIPAAEYSSTLSDISKFLSYTGYYFFALPHNSSLTFSPAYTYSHTDRSSSYVEEGQAPLFNSAVDNTDELKADIRLNHDFGCYGNLLAFLRTSYENHRTRYHGSANSYDRAKSSRVGAGITYNLTHGGFYGSTGFGWDWDNFQFDEINDHPSSPWFDISLQYSFRNTHSLAMDFHYSTKVPSPSHKSANIIQSTPLMSFTGNPGLMPDKGYDYSVSYNWIPNNNHSLSIFAWGWTVGDRYAFEYLPTPTGILRTIRQPSGAFTQWKAGADGTLKFLDRNLVFMGHIACLMNHNGVPYNVNHSKIEWYARARYYLNNWNFTLTYISPTASAEGYMSGIWERNKSDWYVTVGWANTDWNIRLDLIDFSRWNWRSTLQTMRSRYYDLWQQNYDGTSHALIQLSGTYTFSFGKKVKRDNEPQVSGTASSGILE